MTGKGFSGKPRAIVLILLAGASLAACGTTHSRLADANRPPSGANGYKVGKPYQVGGIWYVPREQPNYDERGVASWYGDQFHMKPTANGELFDINAVSAAHTTLPLPSIVEVTNLENGKTIQVRVNDRGPFVGGRVIDLSREAARQLGYDRKGLAKVRVRYVGPATLGGPKAGLRYASAPARPAAPAYQPPANIYAAPAYTPPASVTVASAQLPPVAGAPISAPIAPGPYAAAAGGLYRIQAGAFSDQGAAERVASQLSQAGLASIEPVQRGDSVLYRVMLQGGSDEGEAWALRDRVASFGYAEARVLRPF